MLTYSKVDLDLSGPGDVLMYNKVDLDLRLVNMLMYSKVNLDLIGSWRRVYKRDLSGPGDVFISVESFKKLYF